VYAFGRAVREVGLALDRVGCRLQGNFAHAEDLSRHQSVLSLLGQKPNVESNVFVAPNAAVIGDVKIGALSSVWYGAVLRGDVNSITIGSNTSIGDHAIIHVSGNNQRTGPSPTIIGNNVTIGNGAIVHGSTLKDNCSIEVGAIVFDRVVVEENAVVGAGSVVTEGTTVPSGELWAGTPARFVRKLTSEEQSNIQKAADGWQGVATQHATEHKKQSFDKYIETE